MLVRLTYISKPTRPIVETVRELLPKAQLQNHIHKVTSFMVIHHEFYFQTLEGSHVDVNNLYKVILNDPRHTNVYLIDYEVVEELKFPLWDLAATTLPIQNRAEAEALIKADPKTPELKLAAEKMKALIDSELVIQKYLKELQSWK